MPRHVALLRAVNVGGRNKVPMKELCTVARAAGCAEVSTYIQSGNVVFSAPAALARKLPAVLAAAIEARFGCKVPVVVRSAAELAAVAASNPYLRAGVDPDRLHVAFLADRPSAAQIATLDPGRSPQDRFEVQGHEIYLHLPGGAGASKLTVDYFDRKLATTSTIRNWRTVLKLLQLSTVP